MPLPHFIIAGATRSGTTSLYRYLRAHPDVFMPQRKELQFFNDDSAFARGLDHYGDMFQKARDGQVVGEATPMYMEKGVFHGPEGIRMGPDDSAALRMGKCLPQVRIIVSLRNPVTRFESMFLKHHLTGKITTPPAEHLAMEMDGPHDAYGLLYKGRYAVHLAHLLDVFPRERVMIMIFEEWTADVPGALKKLYRFLDLKDAPLPRDAGVVYNDANRYLPLGRLRQAVQRLLKRKTAPKSRHIDFQELHPRLRAFHLPDVEYVESVIGRRLGAWR